MFIHFSSALVLMLHVENTERWSHESLCVWVCVFGNCVSLCESEHFKDKHGIVFFIAQLVHWGSALNVFTSWLLLQHGCRLLLCSFGVRERVWYFLKLSFKIWNTSFGMYIFYVHFPEFCRNITDILRNEVFILIIKQIMLNVLLRLEAIIFLVR